MSSMLSSSMRINSELDRELLQAQERLTDMFKRVDMAEATNMSDTILHRLHDKTAKYNLALKHVKFLKSELKAALAAQSAVKAGCDQLTATINDLQAGLLSALLSNRVLQAKLYKSEGRVHELEAANRRYSDDTTDVDIRYRAAALNSQVVQEAAQPAFNTKQVSAGPMLFKKALAATTDNRPQSMCTTDEADAVVIITTPAKKVVQDKLLANKACASDLPKDTSNCNGQSINVDRRQKQVRAAPGLRLLQQAVKASTAGRTTKSGPKAAIPTPTDPTIPATTPAIGSTGHTGSADGVVNPTMTSNKGDETTGVKVEATQQELSSGSAAVNNGKSNKALRPARGFNLLFAKALSAATAGSDKPSRTAANKINSNEVDAQATVAPVPRDEPQADTPAGPSTPTAPMADSSSSASQAASPSSPDTTTTDTSSSSSAEEGAQESPATPPAQEEKETLFEQPPLPPFCFRAQVVSGGHYPQLASADSHTLVNVAPRSWYMAARVDIPPVHVPAGRWGDVVTVRLSYKAAADGSGRQLVSTLMEHHVAAADSSHDVLASTLEEVVCALQAAKAGF